MEPTFRGVTVKQHLLKDTLGIGAFGKVKLGEHLVNAKTIAVKILSLSKVHRDEVRKEICVHKMLKHPNIVSFLDHEARENTIFLLLELSSCGELFDKIQPDKGMPLAVAHLYYKQLIEAVTYMHRKGIAHRDIKPENILLDTFCNVKVTDLGLATVFCYQGKRRPLTKRCGTAPYTCPEVFARRYEGPECDLWSSSVVLIAMLAGCLPWKEPTAECSKYRAFVAGDHKREPWISIQRTCPSAYQLLCGVLAADIKTRWMEDKIRTSHFFTLETHLTKACNDQGMLTEALADVQVPEPLLEITDEDDSMPTPKRNKSMSQFDDESQDGSRSLQDEFIPPPPVRKCMRFKSSLPLQDTYSLLENALKMTGQRYSAIKLLPGKHCIELTIAKAGSKLHAPSNPKEATPKEVALPPSSAREAEAQLHASPSSATAPTQARALPTYVTRTAEDHDTNDAPKILEPGLERVDDVVLTLSVRCFLRNKHVLVDFMKMGGDGLAYSRECNHIRQLVGDKAHFSTFLTGAVASQATQKRA
eukprot:m.251199 g.251199  ORF g.251199 m.251199 type:complete len:532 (-) comp17520_c0_seq1:6703-8298(-)